MIPLSDSCSSYARKLPRIHLYLYLKTATTTYLHLRCYLLSLTLSRSLPKVPIKSNRLKHIQNSLAYAAYAP